MTTPPDEGRDHRVDVAHISYWPPVTPGSYNQSVGRLVQRDLGLRQLLIASDVPGDFRQGQLPNLRLVPSVPTGRARRAAYRFSRRSALDRWAASRSPEWATLHRGAVEVCREVRPRLVVVWDDVRLAVRLARDPRIGPVVLSQHGTRYDLPALVDEAVYRSDLLAGLVVLSERARAANEVAGPIVPAVSVIPNAVDTETFRPVSADERVVRRHELGLGDGPVGAVVGRLRDIKGVHIALEAWALVRRRHPDALLVVVGDGDPDYTEQLHRRAQQPDLAGAVRFRPPCSSDEVARILQAADVLLFPTYAPEGMPVIVLEAMASGVPVIGHDFVSRTEIAEPEQGLRWVPRDRPDLLAAEVERVVTDPDLRAAYGSAARGVAVDGFSFDTYAARCRQLFLERLADGSGAG